MLREWCSAKKKRGAGRKGGAPRGAGRPDGAGKAGPQRGLAGGTGSRERIENDVAGQRAGGNDTFHQRERLLRAVELLPVPALLACVPVADREMPDAPHLLPAVLLLERVVVEG